MTSRMASTTTSGSSNWIQCGCFPQPRCVGRRTKGVRARDARRFGPPAAGRSRSRRAERPAARTGCPRRPPLPAGRASAPPWRGSISAGTNVPAPSDARRTGVSRTSSTRWRSLAVATGPSPLIRVAGTRGAPPVSNDRQARTTPSRAMNAPTYDRRMPLARRRASRRDGCLHSLAAGGSMRTRPAVRSGYFAANAQTTKHPNE